MMPPRRLDVALGDARYDIVIGNGWLASPQGETDPFLDHLVDGKQVYVLYDAIFDDPDLLVWQQRLVARLTDARATAVHGIATSAGEHSKSWEQLQHLCDAMLRNGIKRDAMVVLFGGGVVGDIGGLAASLVMRGVPFVQCPTTLLAMIDSSVGGKLAINSQAGKNLVGLFQQPRQVIIDADLLATLPAREIAAGFAEMVKYGALGDAAFFAWLEEHATEILALDDAPLTTAIAHCCAMKARIVAEDEKEHGARALLNLGHTFGHAIETIAARTGCDVLHGEAVACGMVMAAKVSVALGRLSSPETAQLEHLLARAGLPITLVGCLGVLPDLDGFVGHMMGDKKASQSGLTLVLLSALGDARLAPGFREHADDPYLSLTSLLASLWPTL
ncbi:MAG: 3-dehydroquinate synthase [Alphaproteobacteria bacterium]|nr:3-dehydroquinate synthase [Alphaproteobacteria bacterium]